MTPFEAWFSSDFQKRIRTVTSEPGVFSNGFRIDDASWDRKAAFMLWEAEGRPAPTYPSLQNPDPKESFVARRYEAAPPAAEPNPMDDVLG